MMLKRTCPVQAVAVGWLHSPPPPPPSGKASGISGVSPTPTYQQQPPMMPPTEGYSSSTVDRLLQEVDAPLVDRNSIKAAISDFVVRLRAYTPRGIGGAHLPEYTAEVLKHQLGELYTQELVQYLRSSHSAPLGAFSCVALAILDSPVWVSLATCRLTNLSVHTTPFVLSLEGNTQRHWGLNFDSDIRPLTGGVSSVSAVSTTCGVLGCQFVNAIQTSSPSAVNDPLFIYTHHVPMEAAGGSVSQLSQGIGGTYSQRGSPGVGGVPVPLVAATALRSEMKRRVRRVWGLRGQEPYEDVPFAVARGPQGQPILVSPYYILGKSVAPDGSPAARKFPNTNSTMQSISAPTQSPFDVDATYSEPLYDDVGAAMAALTDPAVAASIPPGPHPPHTSPDDGTIELRGWISDTGVTMGGPTHVYLGSNQPPSRWPFAPWRITVCGTYAEGKPLVSLSGNYLHITQIDSPGVAPCVSHVSHHNPYDLSGSPFDPPTSHLMRLRHVAHGWSSSSLWLTEDEAFKVMGATLLPAQQPVLVSNPLQGRHNVEMPTPTLRPYFNVCQFAHTPSHRPLHAERPVATSVSGVPLLRDIREVRGAVLVKERACGHKSLLQSEVTLNGISATAEVREQLRDASRRLGFKSPNFFTTSFIGSIGCTLQTGQYPFPLPLSYLAYDASTTDAFKWPTGYTPTWLPQKESATVTSLMARTADASLSGVDRSWAAARLLLESRMAIVGNLEEELTDRVEAVVRGELLPPWPPLLPPQVSVPIIAASRQHYQACHTAPTNFVNAVVNADQLDLPVSEGRFRQILQMKVSFVWPHRNMHRFHMLRKIADTEVVAMSHGDPNDTIFCPADLLRLAGISPLPTAQPIGLSHGDFFSWFTELDCDHPFLAASQTSSPDVVAAMFGAQHVSQTGTPIMTNHAKAVLSAYACRRGFLTAGNWERPQVWFSISHLLRAGIKLRPCPSQLPGVGETSIEFVGNSEPVVGDPRCVDLEAHYPQYNLGIGGRAITKGKHDSRCFVHLRDLSL